MRHGVELGGLCSHPKSQVSYCSKMLPRVRWCGVIRLLSHIDSRRNHFLSHIRLSSFAAVAILLTMTLTTVNADRLPANPTQVSKKRKHRLHNRQQQKQDQQKLDAQKPQEPQATPENAVQASRDQIAKSVQLYQETPSRILHFVEQVFESTVAHVLAAALIALGAWLYARRKMFGTPLYVYRKHLREQLKMMPFIYADLQGEVLNDFVEVEIRLLDKDLPVGKAGGQTPLSDRERLRRTRRIIFLGDAGIGKTTFQRYAILSLLNGPVSADFVYPAESLIPIYVPLKLVDNSEPFPVLRFILKTNELFHRKHGLKRFISYAKKRRLFLFLDGYDEISVDKNTNHLRDELAELFKTAKVWQRESSGDKMQKLAIALRSCRIWLASRKEFFAHNAIKIGSTPSAGPDAVAALEVGGVGSNRSLLAKNVFDKYRRRDQKFYKPLLSEEYFLSEIDRSTDRDAREISYNPLFLTVMCYVYVSEVAKRHDYHVDWLKSGFEDLIMTCVRLLLVDLDEAKARDLPESHREGLLRRRNEYNKEKEAFLMYFAAELLLSGKGTTTLPILRQYIRDFFKSENWSTQDEILNQMNESRSGRPDFALQLVYAGIFTIVTIIDGEKYYDFPHRRFREILALRYVKTAPKYCRALLQVDRVHFEEFLLLLRDSNLVKGRDFQLSALQHLLSQAVNSDEPEQDVLASKNFFRILPKGMNFETEIKNWLKQMADSPRPSFAVSREVLKTCASDLELPQIFVRAMEESILRCQPERFALALRALEIAWPSLASEVLRRQHRQIIVTPVVRPKAVRASLILAADLTPDWIEKCCSDQSIAGDFLFAMARDLEGEWRGKEEWKKVWDLLSPALRVQALGYVLKFAPSAFGTYCGFFRVDLQPEWMCTLLDFPLNELNQLADSGRSVYISSEKARDALDKKIRDFSQIYVRAKVPDREFNKKTMSWRDLVLEIDVLPTELAVWLENMRSALEASKGKRVQGWDNILSGARSAVKEWLLKLTPQNHSLAASGNRQEIKAADLSGWLFESVDGAVTVSASRLREFEQGTVAWSYSAAKMPDFFG